MNTPRPGCNLAAMPWLLAMATALPAQQPGLEALVERTVAQLADPAQAAAAARRLVGLGPRIVPLVRDLLHHRNAAMTTAAQRGTLLYVLGQHGKEALPAVPELRDLVRGSDELLACQAMWVLGRIAPWLDEEVGDAIREDVFRSVGRNDTRAGVLVELLRLGRDPTVPQLVAALSRRSVQCVAACQWLVAHADEPPTDPVVRTTLEAQLQLLAQRPFVVFNWADRIEPPELAEAWLALTREPLQAASARGLLTHWHPDQRRRAVAWMQENGATLPVMERIDLALRLWDGDPELASAAAAALAQWGAAGLVGLAPLRTLAREHADAAVRARCAGAADTIVAACAAWPAADRALVTFIDACLQQQAPAPPSAPPGDAGAAAIASLLHLAAWSPAPAVTRVFDCLHAGSPHDDLVAAIYGLTCARDAAIGRAALAWLSHHPAKVRDLVARRTDQGLAWECQRLAWSWTAAEARRTAIEAGAWLQSDGVDTAELAPLLASTDTRVVARAVAEIISRGAAAAREHTAQLQALGRMSDDTPLRLFADGPVHAVLLAPTIRQLAALALASTGAAVPEDVHLAAWTRRACGIEPAGLPQWVDAHRASGELATLVDSLEAACREALAVPAELRWPCTRRP